jgi:hypothetical protein
MVPKFAVWRGPLSIVSSVIFLALPTHAANLPKPQGRVNDFAGILSAKTKEDCAVRVASLVSK